MKVDMFHKSGLGEGEEPFYVFSDRVRYSRWSIFTILLNIQIVSYGIHVTLLIFSCSLAAGNAHAGAADGSLRYLF